MRNQTMLISPATPDDLLILLTLRDDASSWLAHRGLDQWSSAWPTKDLMTKAIAAGIRAGEVFIVWDGSTPAATITVDQWANPDLWSAVEIEEPAIYVHRLIVARSYAGQRLGGELLDWAGARASETGARWLRLDAWTTNHALQLYYVQQGFEHLRTVTLSHNPSGALFQRPAARRPTPRISAPLWHSTSAPVAEHMCAR